MNLLERYRAHRRRVLGIDDLSEQVRILRYALDSYDTAIARDHKKVMESLAEIRALLGLTPNEVRTPTYHIHGKDPHGLG